MTTREPEWDGEQLDLILALLEYEAERSPDGFLYSETTSENANPEGAGQARPIRFIPHGPFTDWAVKARMDAEQAEREKRGKDANLNGVFFTLERKEFAAASESMGDQVDDSAGV